MRRPRHIHWRHLLSGIWLLSLVLLHACANPMPPPGGPQDEVAPWLVATWPDSASTGSGVVDELVFVFSEKMDRTEAYRWLNIFPDRNIHSTSWKGAQQANVRLTEPLPADTVVVIEIKPGMKDSHSVPQSAGRTYVFSTGDSLPDGEIYGSLVLEDVPLAGGVVEIVSDGPDTVRIMQRPVLRRAVADSTGQWKMPWLPADGHGWLMRAYEDKNNDRRVGENESQRVWEADTLRLTPDQPTFDTAVRIVYKPDTPGFLDGTLESRPDSLGDVMVVLYTISESDTGYVPTPQPPRSMLAQVVADTGMTQLTGAGPGMVRGIFFVDLDGDSLFSAVGDTADTLWSLEPWALVDSMSVEPGLISSFPAPVWPDTLTPWPAPAMPDSLAIPDSLSTYPDSLTVYPDSLVVYPDSLVTAPVDTTSPIPDQPVEPAPEEQ